MKLVKNETYLLLTDEEAEILQMDLYFDVDCDTVARATLTSDQYSGCKKIIAYYPLIKEAKELDLPLLPNPFEKEIDETTLFKNLGHECFIKMKELNPSGGIKEFIRIAVEFGYKAAQSKQFSLEDMKKANDLTQKICERNAEYVQRDRKVHVPMITIDEEEEIIQLLSTQQLPKFFIPEYEFDCCNRYLNCKGCDATSEMLNKRLKTITNSEGKEVIQGTWKY